MPITEKKMADSENNHEPESIMITMKKLRPKHHKVVQKNKPIHPLSRAVNRLKLTERHLPIRQLKG